MKPPDPDAKPDNEPTEASQRDKTLIVVATIVFIALPLVLGAMRLLGYI